MLSDEWLQRYRLLENFTAKWNGNGNAYDRGDYNSSFALRAVELKIGLIGRKTFFYLVSVNFGKSFADSIFTQHFAYKSERF